MRTAHEGEGSTRLDRLFEETHRCLKNTDLPGANAAIKKVHAGVASTGGILPRGRETVEEFEDRG
ncbi:MAG: hypothetical protein ACRDTR_13225 [Rubrobacter sp.]